MVRNWILEKKPYPSISTTNYDPQRIAVERNSDIVFKAEYAATVLEDGDSLEIVSFVGGG